MNPTVQSHHIIFTHVSVSDRTVRRPVVHKSFLAKFCAFEFRRIYLWPKKTINDGNGFPDSTYWGHHLQTIHKYCNNRKTLLQNRTEQTSQTSKVKPRHRN